LPEIAPSRLDPMLCFDDTAIAECALPKPGAAIRLLSISEPDMALQSGYS
jgi:hypothetical protein